MVEARSQIQEQVEEIIAVTNKCEKIAQENDEKQQLIEMLQEEENLLQHTLDDEVSNEQELRETQESLDALSDRYT